MKTENIQSTNWLTKGIKPEKLESEKALALISAKIYLRRKELGMDQKEFAKLMGVSQSMISKWESEEYNFSIETLVNICIKLDLIFEPSIFPKKDCCPEAIAYNDTVFTPQSDSDNYYSWTPSSQPINVGGVA